jgi:hypothetical protein
MGCAAALGLLAASLQPARAAEPGKPSPTLVVALYARPADRPVLRQELAQAQAARLAGWRAQGLISGYRLLFTRYADAGVWDGLEVLTFPDEAALSRWSAVEREGPGGITPRALERVTQVVTTPAEQVRHAARSPGGPAPSFLVVPYAALVPTPDYLKYLDGYTLPQFEGWMGEGVLDGYDIELSRYPADRPWLSLILLRYHDDAALAQRDATTAKVRARLADDPAWKAISDTKKAVRTEKVAAVADQLAAGGVDR